MCIRVKNPNIRSTFKNPVAARIFVSGEVHEDYIGDMASTLLFAANETLKEPLFIQTKALTIQMTRFDTQNERSGEFAE